MQNTLRFKANGSYKCQLSLAQAKAAQVIAKGVTIESGARFVLLPKGNQSLAAGTVFTVINNTDQRHLRQLVPPSPPGQTPWK